jgi:hypothetical protein
MSIFLKNITYKDLKDFINEDNNFSNLYKQLYKRLGLEFYTNYRLECAKKFLAETEVLTTMPTDAIYSRLIILICNVEVDRFLLNN